MTVNLIESIEQLINESDATRTSQRVIPTM